MLSANSLQTRLREALPVVMDFPRHGIAFRDITPVLADYQLLGECATELAKPWLAKPWLAKPWLAKPWQTKSQHAGARLDGSVLTNSKLANSELAGSVPAGSKLANPRRAKSRLGLGSKVTHVAGVEARGFLLGPLVAQELEAAFVPIRKPGKLPPSTHSVEYQLEYGKDTLEIRKNAAQPGESVLIVDDVLATGGTIIAATKLIQALGADLAGFAFLVDLKYLGGKAHLQQYLADGLAGDPAGELASNPADAPTPAPNPAPDSALAPATATPATLPIHTLLELDSP